MSDAALALSIETLGADGLAESRCEPRDLAVRLVDYAEFPRAGQGPSRVGFTRDHSPRGMCISVERPEAVGALLRITLRHLDGRPARSTIERVVWCNAGNDGRFWLGLELVAEASPAAADG